jgi:hypothetical protein
MHLSEFKSCNSRSVTSNHLTAVWGDHLLKGWPSKDGKEAEPLDDPEAPLLPLQGSWPGAFYSVAGAMLGRVWNG